MNNNTLPVVVIVGVMAVIVLFSLSSSPSTPAPTAITALYTTATAKVRSCGSLSCKSVGTYPPNTTIGLIGSPEEGITDISQLPEWVAFIYSDKNGKDATGYINKSLLTTDSSGQQVATITGTPLPTINAPARQSPQPTQTTLQTPTPQPLQTLQPTPGSVSLSTDIINRIESFVVEINCYSSDGTYVSMGSGTSVDVNGTIYIMTNYHMLSAAYRGGTQPTCYAVYPQPPDYIYNTAYGDYQLTLVGSKYNPNIYQDVAAFTLGAPVQGSVALNGVPSTADVPELRSEGCPEAKVADQLTVFGYPNSGNALGISETVTEGIISGILPGPIYKTNAGIDHGNSGGLAVLNRSTCNLGIPTLGASGLTAGIGYIQSMNLLFK